MTRILPQNIRQTANLAACWWFDSVAFKHRRLNQEIRRFTSRTGFLV